MSRLPLVLAVVFLGCGDGTSHRDAADGTPDAEDVADTADAADTSDTADADDTADAQDIADTEDASETHDEDAPTDEHGFQIRVPQIHTVPQEDFDGTIHASDQPDIDHVCRLEMDGVETFLYVRADPVRCRSFGGCEYTVTGAFTTRAGAENLPIAGVAYDYGGNHHNDFITVPSGEGTLKIYHSSFGFGFRACQPPDCVQVLDGADVTLDGCTPERTRPAACVRIADDGSEPPFAEFARCPGDPNAP